MLGIIKSRQGFNVVKDEGKGKIKHCPCGVMSYVMETYGGMEWKLDPFLTPALDVDG